MTIFDNAKALWQWEFSQQAEQTLADAAATAKNLAGATILLVKLMDGTDWMSLFDPQGYSSLAQFQADAAAAQANGVTVIPWVVPHGQDPAGEAAAHAQLGSVLMVDLEPYRGFWTGPASGIPTYLQALRAGGVKEIHVSIDPRAAAVAAIGGYHVLDPADGIHPQVYWTTFQQPAADVVPMIQAIFEPGGPLVYPALPGEGTASDMAAVWTAAQGLGCDGVSVWRLGSMSSQQLAAFANLVMPASTPPPQGGTMTPDQVNAAIAAAIAPLQTQIDAQALLLSRLNDVLAKRFQLVMAALDPANPPA